MILVKMTFDSYIGFNLTNNLLDTQANEPQQLFHQWHAAKFILSIKERHTLTQSAVDCVIESTLSLMSSVNMGILNELKITERIPENLMHLLEQKFDVTESLFSELLTSHQQRKYFKQKFHKIVRARIAVLDYVLSYIFYRNQLAQCLVVDTYGKEVLQSIGEGLKELKTHSSIYHF